MWALIITNTIYAVWSLPHLLYDHILNTYILYKLCYIGINIVENKQ